MLHNMIVLATQRHAGQFDKSGAPYILHPLKVMDLTESDDEEIQCMAVGHDLIEDTETSFAELRAMGFTERIIKGIDALTKHRGQDYEEYVAKLKGNPDAMIVKIADLRHNTDLTRLKGVTEKDQARMVRYHKLYLDLAATLKGHNT